MPKSVFHVACVLTALAILWGVYSELRSWIFRASDTDFAGLLHRGMSGP